DDNGDIKRTPVQEGIHIRPNQEAKFRKRNHPDQSHHAKECQRNKYRIYNFIARCKFLVHFIENTFYRSLKYGCFRRFFLFLAHGCKGTSFTTFFLIKKLLLHFFLDKKTKQKNQDFHVSAIFHRIKLFFLRRWSHDEHLYYAHHDFLVYSETERNSPPKGGSNIVL